EEHHQGALLGKMRLIQERCPSGNKYLYEYKGDNLSAVKATNREGAVLAELKHRVGRKKTVWSAGPMSVTYTRSVDARGFFSSIEPSHGIPSTFTCSPGAFFSQGTFTLQKDLPEQRSLRVRFLNDFKGSHVQSVLAPVGPTAELLP